MEVDDAIYLILLLVSIGIGHYYRDIEDTKRKQLVGTLIGLGITIAVSGFHFIHIIIFTSINLCILLLIDKRKCHLVSFAFSFSYLIFFRTTAYFGIPYPPAHTNLIIMMLTLKLVGLAFELNTVYIRKKDTSNANEEALAEFKNTDIKVSFIDIIHYAFNYVGVLTGPYYTYRTYWDSLNTRYYKFAECHAVTMQKLMYVPMYCVLFLTASYIWPLSYALSNEFYTERSILYRLWYVVPTFFIFRMRIYTGLVLSECVCTMAGLGAYPVVTDPKPGRGPSTNFVQLTTFHDDPNLIKEQTYNFETIHSINPYGSDFCVTFREGMKHWNMCIQYWLAVVIYKRFPFKQLRTLATMFISAIWHGVYIGHYFCICGAPFYLPIEDLYYKRFLKYNDGQSKVLWEWVIYAFKMLAFSYLGFAFQLLTVERVMQYYNSVYHAGCVLGILLYITGVFLVKTHKATTPVNSVER